jgi:hypothetical protein
MDKRSAGASFKVISWEQYIPLTDRFMLYDLVRVFVASLAIMQASLLVMAFFIGEDPVILPLRIYLILFFIFSSLYLFVALAIFRNKYWARFVLAPEGAMYKMGLREQRINRLVLALSLLFRRPGAAGASLLAISQESGIVEWKDVYNVKVYPKERVVALSNSWRTVLRLYCSAENFELVADRAQSCAEKGAQWRSRHCRPVRHRWTFYILWTASALAAALAALAWFEVYYDLTDRIAILAGILVLFLGFTASRWWSRLVALSAAGVCLWFLVRLALLAIDPIIGPTGTFYGYSYELETPMLVVSAAGGIALLAMSCAGVLWRLPATYAFPKSQGA